jgi:N-acetylglutamate synthase-like GNAT family acetyltransferase
LAQKSGGRVYEMVGLKSGNIEGFEQFSQFSSLQELNTHMEMWLAVHKQDFSKGALVGLKRLVRFSAKIPGVCNAKIGTILKAIHQEYKDNGISRSTFKRMIQKAKELGILSVYETERKNGSQSSNLYSFNRFPSNEPPEEEIMNHPKETNNLLKTEKDQKKKERKEEPSELDHTYVSDQVPQPFVQLVKCFFPAAKTIEEYWKIAKISAYQNLWENDAELILDVAIQSFKQLIRKLKFNRNIKNPFAYFYGILNHKFFILYDEELKEKYDLSDVEMVFSLGLNQSLTVQ